MDKSKMTAVAPILVLLAGVSWGLIGIFSNALSDGGFSSQFITAIRCGLSAISLIIYLLITDREKLRFRIKDIWIFMCSGILSIAFFNICYFISITENGLGVSCILLYTSPIFVMIMSCIFFKEKFTAVKLISLLASFAGCILITGIVGSETKISLYGLLVGLGSGIGYALYSIFGKVALNKYDFLTFITYTFVFAFLAMVPLCMLQLNAIPHISSGIVINSLLLAGVSTLLPFCLYTKGLQYMETGKASIIAFAEPLTATVVSVAVFNERLSAMHIAGIVLICFSIIILNAKIKRCQIS